MLDNRVSAIVRTDDTRLAANAMAAAVRGGFRTVEFTLTTPGAVDLVAEFAKDRSLCVGAGTVLSEDDVHRVAGAGGRFVVSPVCDPALIRCARDAGLATIPGTFTASEMWTAHRSGADLVKLFPAPADIPTYVAAILGPLPMLKIFPTNGVTIENLGAVLAAGAVGAGFVGTLFRPDDLRSGNMEAIEGRARAILAQLSSTRVP